MSSGRINHSYTMGANALVSKASAATRIRVKRSLTETMASLSRPPKSIVSYMKDRVAAVRDRDEPDVVDSSKAQLAEMMDTVYFTENALLESRRQLDAIMRERDQLQVENNQLREELVAKKAGTASACCRHLDFVLKDRAHLQLVNNQLRKELLNTMDELVSSLAEANRAQKKLSEIERKLNPGYSRSEEILKSGGRQAGDTTFGNVSSTNQVDGPLAEIRVDFNKKSSTYRKKPENDEY